ncbi:di-heme-cytochrome C peroxidase [Halioxenophilus sp. WMMB6]|uniref:di-heme-cytochrome C peroxidase n=1 Tax=Halioxenophilus sp. WMMB6 TaxID=3073815 RepID=UPI00295EF071|nr:di-heme-cytochrome C peroxidase [Halioxenophilus sp. WMMB6]
MATGFPGRKRSSRHWLQWLLLVIVVLLVIGFLTGRKLGAVVEGLTPPKLPAAPVASQRYWPEQNWNQPLRQQYHHISQGTRTLPIPLSWLLALEKPAGSLWTLPFGNKGKFTDNDYLLRFGFIKDEVSDYNPYGLPIGFALTANQNLPGISQQVTAVGFNCSACHTSHFIYNDSEYVIDGGPATTDLGQLTKALGAALGQTLVSAKVPLLHGRFNRFAKNVLGADGYNDANALALADELVSLVEFLASQPGEIDVVEGFSRLDALNRIGNQVFALDPGRFQNYVAINAPVNYPHIWTSSWFDWVQYDGSIMNPLIRNTGEAMGVSAYVNSWVPHQEKRFASSVATDNLLWIEKSLSGSNPVPEQKFSGLLSPPWPKALPAIDTALAHEGELLYGRLCQGCHLPAPNTEAFWSEFKHINYQDENGHPQQVAQQLLHVHVIDHAQIGTDPAQGNVLVNRTVDTAGDSRSEAGNSSAMGIDTQVCTHAPQLPANPYNPGWPIDRSQEPKPNTGPLVTIPISDGPNISFALALGGIVQQVNDTWFAQNYLSPEQQAVFEEGRPNCLQAGQGYKARPLNGVWATAPFLHNGSVPTLYHLLSPVVERPAAFTLGAIDFDPVHVGLEVDDSQQKKLQSALDDGKKYTSKGLFILDTRVPGNSNQGHEFSGCYDSNQPWWNQPQGAIGPELSPEQRLAIIEYLKTL